MSIGYRYIWPETISRLLPSYGQPLPRMGECQLVVEDVHGEPFCVWLPIGELASMIWQPPANIAEAEAQS